SEGRILPPEKNPHSTGDPGRAKDSPPAQANSAGPEARLTGRQGCLPPRLLILTTGDAGKNRQFFAEHKLECPVLLQKETEVATGYQAKGTPSGYLISAEGRIASELTMGAEALLALAADAPDPKSEEEEEDRSLVTSAAPSRFSNRSLARSKIKRDGLKAGTPAP